jgi:hypothetical protein
MKNDTDWCLMKEPFPPRKPRFKTGDRVRAVGPSVRPREHSGTVSEIVVSAENVIYRYRVTFPDGSTEIFYGFELDLTDS